MYRHRIYVYIYTDYGGDKNGDKHAERMTWCQDDLDLARWECKRLEKRLAQARGFGDILAGETAPNLGVFFSWLDVDA